MMQIYTINGVIAKDYHLKFNHPGRPCLIGVRHLAGLYIPVFRDIGGKAALAAIKMLGRRGKI